MGPSVRRHGTAVRSPHFSLAANGAVSAPSLRSCLAFCCVSTSKRRPVVRSSSSSPSFGRSWSGAFPFPRVGRPGGEASAPRLPRLRPGAVPACLASELPRLVVAEGLGGVGAGAGGGDAEEARHHGDPRRRVLGLGGGRAALCSPPPATGVPAQRADVRGCITAWPAYTWDTCDHVRGFVYRNTTRFQSSAAEEWRITKGAAHGILLRLALLLNHDVLVVVISVLKTTRHLSFAAAFPFASDAVAFAGTPVWVARLPRPLLPALLLHSTSSSTILCTVQTLARRTGRRGSAAECP